MKKILCLSNLDSDTAKTELRVFTKHCTSKITVNGIELIFDEIRGKKAFV